MLLVAPIALTVLVIALKEMKSVHHGVRDLEALVSNTIENSGASPSIIKICLALIVVDL